MHVLISRLYFIVPMLMPACHQLAEYYQVVEKNFDEALKLFSDTCFQKNFGESCFALGNMYITGKSEMQR